MRTLTIETGGGLEQALDRFKTTWLQAEQGEATTNAGESLGFPDIETLQKTLTAGRWTLIEALQRTGPASPQTLASQLQRDVQSVVHDLSALEPLGIIEDHPDGGVWVPFDEIHMEVTLRRVA